MIKNLLRTSLLLSCASLFVVSCKKEVDPSGLNPGLSSASKSSKDDHEHTKKYSSDVITSWLNMQLAMLKTPLPPGTGSQASDRCQVYCGVAVYEAVVPGMPSYQSLSGQLNGLADLPQTERGRTYHWAAAANAALADMNRDLFPTTAAINKTKMNQLEDSLKAIYATETDPSTLQRSIDFGKAIAAKVFAWALVDGFSNVNPTYIPPVGPGLWVPTSPTPPVNPYAWQWRLNVPGSANSTALEPPPPYSTDPSSEFYAMVKDVYNVSLVLTQDQKNMADYFKDGPGYSPGGGFIAVLSQALALKHPSLDWAAETYAKVGLAQHDASIVLFTGKYTFNLIRPVTYIRAVIDPSWNTYIPTPNHPEFPSGHATTNGAVLTMMANMFGDHFPITLHTYDYLGYPPRSYQTFTEMGLEMANSRLYGGLHYRPTCVKSIAEGKQVAENILNAVHFKKGGGHEEDED